MTWSSRPWRLGKAATLVALGVLLATVNVEASDDVVLRAMRDELARSMQKLQLEKLEKPYFIAYRVNESSAVGASASFGSLFSTSSPTHTRWLSVEVRVGDYAFDNTNFLSQPSFAMTSIGGFGGSLQLPLEEDYLAIRRQIWLATDVAYKKAVEDLSKKRAALQNKTRTEDLHDFSRVEPGTYTVTAARPELSRSEAEAIVRELSAAFRDLPDVFSSRVDLRSSFTRTLYVSSEGTTFVRETPLIALTVNAETQAADGMPLTDSFAFYGRSITDLPEKKNLLIRIREAGATLAKLRQAPILERYNGPVLLEEQAAAAAFAQVFVPKLLATRRPVYDRPQFEAMAAQADNPFVDKMGGRVLPPSVSVTDQPTISEFARTRLIGGSKVDDDGVPSRETRLVEKGYLKTLLATRVPTPGITKSTGSRYGSGPRPTNLIVSVESGRSDQELKDELLRLTKARGNEFGVVIRRIGNPSLTRDSLQIMIDGFGAAGRQADELRNIVLAYKVYPDGREELIRNAVVSDLTVASFKEIVGVSRTVMVTSVPFSVRVGLPFSFDFGGIEAAAAPISLAVPSLLFEELTLKKPPGQIPKPPVAKHPFFDR
jgi:PmbA/TldA metallopeptidase C-terminal domain